MILRRKFTIWLISFIVVLTAFLFYRAVSNMGVIRIARPEYGLERADTNQFIADSNAGQVGQAKLEYLERARFETVDRKTRKLKRVVGFEKVLHKSGNEWELDKPYMNVFQDKLRCDITADTGTIEIENVEGADPAPKWAILKGNVVAHILPQATASSSDSFVYLNEVTFDSDRSMFFSDDDVNFVSADAHLIGKGLEIVYNSITNRLEYLKVRQVNFLNIKGFAKTNRVKERKTQNTSVKTFSDKFPHPAQYSQPTEIVEPAHAAVEEKNNKEEYQCLFRGNVVLEYEEEVILADEIAITNLLWSPSKEQEEKPAVVDKIAAQNIPEPVPAQQRSLAASLDENKTVIAKVKCDGPMIIRPPPADGSDDYKPAQLVKFYDLPDKFSRWLGRRNVLLAQRVSYDYGKEIAKAYNQVELVFYPRMESEGGVAKPFIISSQKGAEFISKQNQVVFYGNVKGSFKKQTNYYDEENIFYGDKLIINLTSGQNTPEAVESADIAHITVTGPGVRLESVRTLGETKLSHVRLKSERIDYDRITEDIIATGKGIIEYGNVTTGNLQNLSSRKSTLDKPCYTLIEGFDKLIWDTNSMHVSAFSEKSKGVHIGYLPVEKGGYGNRITIDTRQIDIDYFEPTKGKAQIKQLYARGGIVYYEQPRYEFVGRDLYYNAQEDFMTVTGAEDMPCMLNGVLADAIQYNLETGAASAVLGKGIGIMPVRE
jgi:lipopolysaccharide export system protein LptA